MCENAAEAASAEFVGIALVVSPDTYELRFSAGLDAELAPAGANLSMHDDTPFAVALRRGTPISIEWLPDFVTHRAALVRAMVDAGLRSVAFVPLHGEDATLLGALAFAWTSRRDAAQGVDDPRVATVVDVVTTSLQRGAAEEISRRRRAPGGRDVDAGRRARRRRRPGRRVAHRHAKRSLRVRREPPVHRASSATTTPTSC